MFEAWFSVLDVRVFSLTVVENMTLSFNRQSLSEVAHRHEWRYVNDSTKYVRENYIE